MELVVYKWICSLRVIEWPSIVMAQAWDGAAGLDFARSVYDVVPISLAFVGAGAGADGGGGEAASVSVVGGGGQARDGA